jgi:superfamily II DNA or RNA helicase
VRLRAAKLRAARARFAESLSDVDLDARVMGSITLRPDQIDSLRRVRARLASDGGCVLADDPGTGKTYVALAIARAWTHPLVIVPASLRATWADAIRRANARCSLVTHEALSRGAVTVERCDGVIVDESHRFRATSRRHAALARLVRDAPILLLSATPLQNRPRELAAQLALFLGELAYRLDLPSMARHVVRHDRPRVIGLPHVAPPRWLPVRADDGEVLRAILALPPPPRALDVGDGGALLVISLVRAWASSRAALLATLRRRRRTLIAMEQCHEEGRAPTRAELRAWTGGDGVQLGFASLLAEASIDRESATRLPAMLAAERAALDGLAALLAQMDDPDDERAAALRWLRAAHAGHSILAFSESASTVAAYFRALRGDAGVGMLTAREARIASGRIPRAELLTRFAPRAQGVAPPPERERVTLLLATDVLSEGMNLQDASVVVHLDLPWNPARMAQRLGRVRRPGGAHEVFGYLMTPPAESSLLLRAESRLRTKLAQAERTIGRSLDVLPANGLGGAARADDPPLAPCAPAQSDAELRGAIDGLLGRWRRRASPLNGRCRGGVRGTQCIVAGATADVRGWVAVLNDGRIMARMEDRDSSTGACAMPAWIEDDPDRVARALRLADGSPRPVGDREIADVRAELDAVLAADWATRSCGASTAPPALRRAIRRRLDIVLRDVPRHRRVHVFALAARLRDRLGRPMPLGVERALLEHACSSDDGEAWITAALALLGDARAHAGDRAARRGEAVAMIVLGPDALGER